MFKEILQIIPKLSSADLANMEKSLTKRFGNIAKKFGKGLLGALTGGGIAGVALGLVDKLLNPLKETQDAIDRVLKQGDDVVTNAKQFGTTAGKLFRLQAFAKSTGLDAGSLDILLQKFATSVAEAKADPNKQTSVRQFVGEKDMADAFFQFIQGLQKLDKNQQILVQQEVFGEKQILKMADFLQTDFNWQAIKLGGPSSEQLTPGLEKLGELNDLKDVIAAHRELEDTLKKSKLINAGMIKNQDAQEELARARENKNIANYNNLAAISEASTRIADIVQDGILKLTSLVVTITNLSENVKKITSSRLIKGIMKMQGNE